MSAAHLYDLLSQRLSAISLKSELAAKLAETDPARAAVEMTEVRNLARDALKKLVSAG